MVAKGRHDGNGWRATAIHRRSLARQLFSELDGVPISNGARCPVAQTVGGRMGAQARSVEVTIVPFQTLSTCDDGRIQLL